MIPLTKSYKTDELGPRSPPLSQAFTIIPTISIPHEELAEVAVDSQQIQKH